MQQDGALSRLTTKEVALLGGRGFARIKKSQDYEEVESFNSIAEAVAFVGGESYTPESNNPIKKHIVDKYMTDKTVGLLAKLDADIEGATTALGTVASLATSLQQKLRILSSELNNRAVAQDVKGIEACKAKIEGVVAALAKNANTSGLLAIGAELSATSDKFDANEFLGLE